MTANAHDAIERIRAWGEKRDWRGYDPYDGLASPAAGVLSLGTALGRRVLTQAVKLSPLNLRPLLGIRPAWNAKGMALVASAYARLWAAEGDGSARSEAERWLAWLVEVGSGAKAEAAWGYHFDVQTRFFRYPRTQPNTIATSFVAQALLDGYEQLGDERWGEAAAVAARGLVRDMLAERPSGAYFRYLSDRDELVHNANALACAALSRTARLLHDNALEAPAAAALATTLSAQRGDGSWPYAQTGSGGWVDNFHTGYVLESLAGCEGLLPGVREKLERGLEYWERELFLPDGTPKYFSHKALPLDSHCCSQAVETWLSVSSWRPGASERAERTARLLIERMLDPAGYVYFQQRRLWTIKVPFIRWSTAPALRALARLLLDRRSRSLEGLKEEAHSRLD